MSKKQIEIIEKLMDLGYEVNPVENREFILSKEDIKVFIEPQCKLAYEGKDLGYLAFQEIDRGDNPYERTRIKAEFESFIGATDYSLIFNINNVTDEIKAFQYVLGEVKSDHHDMTIDVNDIPKANDALKVIENGQINKFIESKNEYYLGPNYDRNEVANLLEEKANALENKLANTTSSSSKKEICAELKNIFEALNMLGFNFDEELDAYADKFKGYENEVDKDVVDRLKNGTDYEKNEFSEQYEEFMKNHNNNNDTYVEDISYDDDVE